MGANCSWLAALIKQQFGLNPQGRHTQATLYSELLAMKLLPYCLALALAAPSISLANSPVVPDSAFNARPASFRIGMENTTLPGNEKMGLVGVSYLLQAADGLYLGPAFYGANTGKRGGLFTGGFEVAYRLPLLSKLELETGFYAGGGGGADTPDGGGLMLRPHVDLMWRFNKMRAGLSLSSVRFPSGTIKSNQIGLILDFDDVFRHSSPSLAGQNTYYSERGATGFDRISVLGGVYQPNAGVTDSSGLTPQNKVGFAGFRADQFLNENWLWGIEASGAASGGADGYAEVLGSLGVEMPLIRNRLYLGTRASLGMAGGGAIATGGGSLAKTGVYSTLMLSRDYYLTAEGGMVRSPGGEFRARYATLQLGMMLDHPQRGSSVTPLGYIEDWQWSASTQRYTQAARRDGSTRPMEVLGFKINRQLDENFYATGQAHSATHGDAGAFSVGLFGAGWRSDKSAQGLSFATEILIGAAGGGGVHTQGGAITQPMVYGIADISKNWQLKLGAGRIRSIKGQLNSNVYDLSLGYSFGVPTR